MTLCFPLPFPPGGRARAALAASALALAATSALRGDPLQIVPRFQTVLSGEACRFTVQDAGPADPPRRWRVVEPQGGTVSPEGEYTAPAVADLGTFHVRVAPEADPAAGGEATVLVLPREPFGVVAAVLGRDWLPLHSEALPFLDPATDQRPGVDPQVQFWLPRGCSGAEPRRTVGYGLPLTLRWPVRRGMAGARLHCREGDAWVRRDVTGLDSLVLHPRERIAACTLETLDPAPGRPGAFLSHVREFPVSVRGLLPWAGSAAAGPGHGDGRGWAARFREPYGLAVIGCARHLAEQCVVADRAAHVVRAVSAQGEVTTPWGEPGQAGHRDGLGCARFNGPTFVAADLRTPEGRPWAKPSGFVLADSGNQVIRRVDGRGRVETLAGRPGEAGFRDADDPRQALFSDPRGLATTPWGDVFVADRGNGRVRHIAPGGQVTTLAGAGPGACAVDGPGPQARFQALEGLALDGDRALYVADGHAVRRIGPDGEVATVLGVPDRPGFRDAAAGELAGVPCLRDPCGLLVAGPRLFIADRGNHAIREYHLRTGALRTLAGDPDLGQIRFGLLRDGVPGPLGEAWAGLEAPRGLAVLEQGELLAATGPCLVQLCRQHLPGTPLPPVQLRLDRPAAGRSGACGVDWMVPDDPGVPGRQPLLYTLTFIEADGSVATRLEGTAVTGQTVHGEGRLALPGQGRVLLQGVTGQGVARGGEAPVRVE